MCECMCGVWCMYTWKPLICTYPCQLPPQSCSALLLVFQTEPPCLQSSLTGSPVCWVSHSASTLQYEGYRHVHHAPILYGCWGSPYVFVTDTLPNGHLFDFLLAPTCTCAHTNFASLKCLASQEAGRWRVLRPPPPTYTHLASCFLGS